MNNSNVRIGARILSENALNKLLPSNKNIEKQIENTRERAFLHKSIRQINSNTKDSKEKWDREFDRHFNNIFSILGGRGTGKTSVLLTMKYKITNENNRDIILPLIVPEKMGKTSDILGSIIGFLGDEVQALKNSIIRHRKYLCGENEMFQKCKNGDITTLEEKYNELLKQYMYTKTDYREILINQYEGFSDYVNNAKNILDSDQKLIVKFEEFIEELLKEKCKLNNGELIEKEPLIFIFFDDVDLSSERCMEILNVILRYLSHPNLIVFVTGNYRTFSEVLTINNLKKDQLLNEQMEKCFFSETVKDIESALDVRKTLTQDFLKKILPPAFRYNMPMMDEKSKVEFIFSTEEDNEKKKSDSEPNEKKESNKYFSMIELIIKNFVDSNYGEKDYSSMQHTKSFLYYNGKPLYAYFKILDDTQRGTMNVYYFLYSMLNSDASTEELQCLRIRRLLSTLVQSSSILNKYENEINRIIDIRDNFENTFIDYKYIESMLQENQNDKLIDDIVTIFMLASFIENVVVLENRKIHTGSRRKVHGANVLYKILNSQNKEFVLYPNTKNLEMLLQMYTLINMKIPSSNIKNLSDDKKKNYFLGKYFEVIDEIIEKKNGNSLEFFSRLYLEDAKWVEKRIKMIMYHGGGKIIVLLNNIEELYKRVKDMGVSEETLEEIKNNLEKISKWCKENPEDITIEQIINEKDILGKSQKGKTLKKIDIVQIENLVEEYEDKMLLYENRYKNSIPKYKITSEFKQKYIEIIEDTNSINSIREKNILSSIEKYIYEDYLYENDCKKMENNLRMLKRNALRNYSSSLEEKIEEFYLLFKIIRRKISNVEWLDSELRVNEDEFIEQCARYVKLMSLYEIKQREVDIIDSGKGKETFYEKFERLKKELMSWKNQDKYKGFIEYVKEKERESRQVDLNV